jgi:hypothetical protein
MTAKRSTAVGLPSKRVTSSASIRGSLRFVSLPILMTSDHGDPGASADEWHVVSRLLTRSQPRPRTAMRSRLAHGFVFHQSVSRGVSGMNDKSTSRGSSVRDAHCASLPRRRRRTDPCLVSPLETAREPRCRSPPLSSSSPALVAPRLIRRGSGHRWRPSHRVPLETAAIGPMPARLAPASPVPSSPCCDKPRQLLRSPASHRVAVASGPG